MAKIRFLAAVAACTCVCASAFGQNATLRVVPLASTIQQNGTLTIEVFIEDLPRALRGYQVVLSIAPGAGATGSITPVAPPQNVEIQTTRSDWVFTGASVAVFPAVNTSTLAATASLVSGGMGPFASPKYLATYRVQASSNATGPFTLTLTSPTASPAATFLRGPGGQNDPISHTTISATVTAVTPAPNNDICANAVAITDGSTAFNTISTSTDGPPIPGSCDDGDGLSFENDIWFRYTASCTGIVSVSTCGDANFDTRLAIYGGASSTCTCPSLGSVPIACDDDSGTCANGTSALSFNATQGRCYTLRVGAFGNVTGSGNISISCIDNDTCATAKTVAANSTTFGSTQNTTTDSGLPVCGPFGTSTSSGGVWYKVLPTATGVMTASLCGQTAFNSRLSVFEGATCAGLSCVSAADNNCGSPNGQNETVSWCATTGSTYWVLVHGGTGASGSFRLVMSNSACNDNNACTTNACTGGVCVFTSTTPSGFCCTPSSGVLDEIDDHNPCTTDSCNTSTGVVSNSPVPNAPNPACDDDLRCTHDTCTGGVCTNTDINTILCTVSANCPGLGNTCQSNLCRCIEDPTLDLVPSAGTLPISSCFAIGDQITVRVEMGFAPEAIVGAQFFLEYDASTLDFISLRPGNTVDATSPFTFELQETVNEINGTINYGVGVPPGGQGTFGPTTVAVITFQAIDECEPFLRFRDHTPPTELFDATADTYDPITSNMPPIRINGTPPLLVGCPSDVTVGFDDGEFTAAVGFAPPTSSDNCDGALTVTCDPPPGFAFPSGITNVSCSAANSCGVTSACNFDVEVIPSTLTTSVQVSPSVSSASRQRCITFDLWDCVNDLHETVDKNVTMASGQVTNVVVEIPGGTWTCVSARDKLHTLRSTADDLNTTNSINYTATFTGDPLTGGNWLPGGNLNDDSYIDVQDYVRFLVSYLATPNPNTPCGTLPFHADVNQSGVVDVADLSFIQISMFQSHAPACCPSRSAPEDDDGPLESISIRDLRRKGLGHLYVADMNGDDVLDIDDIVAFIEQAPVKLEAAKPLSRPNVHSSAGLGNADAVQSVSPQQVLEPAPSNRK